MTRASFSMRRLLFLLGALLGCVATLGAADVLPPAPENHFNDYARVVRPDTARRLNAELAQFERDTSNQLVVAIYPKLPSNSSVDEYAVRAAQKWGAGQQDRKNGAVLFSFQESHDLRIVRQVSHDVAVMYLGRVVERGVPDAVFGAPAHPYARALVAAIPGGRGPRILLHGAPPNPANRPQGCAFHPRCPSAVARCRAELPVLKPRSGDGRLVACHVAHHEAERAIRSERHAGVAATGEPGDPC